MIASIFPNLLFIIIWTKYEAKKTIEMGGANATENANQHKKYVKSVVSVYEKMQRKPLYKYAAIILGIFTTLSVFIFNKFDDSGRKLSLIYRHAGESIKKENVKENVKQEAALLLSNKLEYFNTTMDEYKFSKKLDKIAEARYAQLLNDKI